MKSKIETYLGFAVKSGNIILGIDSIEYTKKRIYCIIICNTASKNLEKDVFKISDKHRVPIVRVSQGTLGDVLYKENCKVAAITDKQLSKAILENIDSMYMLVKNISGV